MDKGSHKHAFVSIKSDLPHR